jgi:DNA-directed RNA polymerase subunit RPC12/RpoP
MVPELPPGWRLVTDQKEIDFGLEQVMHDTMTFKCPTCLNKTFNPITNDLVNYCHRCGGNLAQLRKNRPYIDRD